jgi:GNAT superfamily N-acetyltransferase
MATAVNAETGAAGAAELRKVESAADVRLAGAILSQAFFADPVLTWTFPDRDRRWRSLPGLFELYAEVFARHGETHITVAGTGTALWLPPGRALIGQAEEQSFAQALEERAGDDAKRLFQLLELLDAHHPQGDYFVLQLLAVEPRWQGRGTGSRLIAPVLARCDAAQVPAYLEATSVLNARLYERHGFVRMGEIPLPDGPSLVPMWRAPA